MVIKNVYLETVCGITSKLPENPYKEVAFAGKSNVGKSSLINSLLNRKALAKTSSQPGKTQTINFYNINEALYLVDLPGYGYTKANVEIKAKWGKMIERYLHTSRQLQAVFLLIDIRHDPSNDDRMMYEWMVYQGFAPIIIATKADKLKRSQIPKHLQAIRDGLGLEPDAAIFPFSSLLKQGREEIWEVIEELTLLAEDGKQSGDDTFTDGDSVGSGEPASRRTEGGNRQKSGQSSADGSRQKSGQSSMGGKRQMQGASSGGARADKARGKNVPPDGTESSKKPRWKSIGRENPAKKRAAAKAKRARKKK